MSKTLNQNLNPISYQKRGKKEERDNLKHKSGNFRMLLKVLMDFHSLKIRDKTHAPTLSVAI